MKVLKKENKKMSAKEFIEKAMKIHGDKYSYEKVNYVNSHEKVKIGCSKHGEFVMIPEAHLQGHKCPCCH